MCCEWETQWGEEGSPSWRATRLSVGGVICLKVMTSKRRRNVWRIWPDCQAWQLGPHDTSKCPRRRTRQAIEAGPQSSKAPLWACPRLASMTPAVQPLADRVNKVASTPALLQTPSVWPELQGLDLKFSSVWCSSYLWPTRRAGLLLISLTHSLMLNGLSVCH